MIKRENKALHMRTEGRRKEISRILASTRKRRSQKSEMRMLAGSKGRSERKRREQKGGNSANLYLADAATASRTELEMYV